MPRHRYIRFFISSTFVDMSKERNLLHTIFQDLNNIYAEQQWQIEYIDLRWGITHEASLDNRTIRICMDELERCRIRSPKPNFIILLGERNGWIPLPEELSLKEAETVQQQATYNELQIFNHWYRIDTNQLPEPIVLLQPRYGDFIDNDKWEHEAYLPLKNLFDRVFKKSISATALEISHGIRTMEDAQYVTAYFRSIKDAPDSFKDKESSEVANLKASLQERLPQRNIYSEQLDYAEYNSEAFNQRFVRETKKRLIDVINRVISEYPNEFDEASTHMEIAESESRFFIGRETELNMLDQYVNDKDVKHALWLKADSGAGKSTLMAQLACRYRTTHNVICRFCGETEQSSDGSHLLNSIWMQMRHLYPLTNWAQTDLPGFGPQRHFIGMSTADMFNTRLHQIVANPKPLLIIVDGIDNLSDEGSEEFFSMKWADCTLCSDVHIVITSTCDPRLDINPTHIDIRDLHAPQLGEAIRIVEQLLRLNGRSLTEEQHWQMSTAIATSDKQPLYLYLMANFLMKAHSYDELPDMPSDLLSLISMILSRQTSVHHHDPHLVKNVLSLFASARYGLSHTEILQILASDSEFMDHLHDSSPHEWHVDKEHPMIPPVLWSRLYADTSFFFKTRYDKFGTLLQIRHGEFLRIIQGLFMDDDAIGIKSRFLLMAFFERLDSAHALAEITRCYQAVYSIIVGINEDPSPIMEQFRSLMTNPWFLYRRLVLDRDGLNADFNTFIALLRHSGAKDVKRAVNLKYDIAEIIPCDWDQFVMQCMNMHPDSELHRLIEADSTINVPTLHDAFSASLPYNLIIGTSTRTGEDPRLSDDGMQVMSLLNNRHKVKIEDMENSSNNREYSLNSPISDIDTSADMSIQAMVTKQSVLVYDSRNNQLLHEDKSMSGVRWISLSYDGKHYAWGNGQHCRIGDRLFSIPAIIGKISPSGQNLWIVTNDALYRIDMQTGNQYCCPCNGLIISNDDDIRLVAASEDSCIMQTRHNLLFIHTYDADTNHSYSYIAFYRMHYHTTIGAINQNRMIGLIDSMCVVLKQEDHRLNLMFETELGDISAISRNMRFVYSSRDQRSYDMELLLKTVRWTSRWNIGINTLACDYAGNCIAASSGINELQDHFPELLLAENNTIRKLSLPSSQTSYFSTCSISPAGDRIWVSEAGEKQSIFMLNRQGIILAEHKQAGSKISMQYTSDGRFVVAGTGNYISDPHTTIHIFTREGRMIRQFTHKEAILKGHLTLSPCNRYAISPDGDIIDLIGECIVYQNDNYNDMVHREIPHAGIRTEHMFAIHPKGRLYIGNSRTVDLKGTVRTCNYEVSIIGCTHGGSYLFGMDADRTLYICDCNGSIISELVGHVNDVYPSHNERFVFVRQQDSTILFMDIHNKRVLQRAYFDNGYYLHVTHRGLAAVSGCGRLSMFEPDRQYGMQDESSATIVYRWDLETKSQSSAPTVVCPACGHEFNPSSEILQRVNTINGLNLDSDSDRMQNLCPNCRATLRYSPFIIK